MKFDPKALKAASAPSTFFEVMAKTAEHQATILQGSYIRLAEIGFWMGLALLPAFFAIKTDFKTVDSILLSYSDHPFWGAYSVITILTPLASFLVFGGMPFELTRHRIRTERKAADAIQTIQSQDNKNIERRANLLTALNAPAVMSIEVSQNFDPRELLAYFAQRSSDTANDIYRRSSIYIFVGVMIAASGLVFFYLRNADAGVSADVVERIVNLAPNIGILFFIELVAFYFLRQHRVSMDEFRYFEQIKRNREENLIILKMYAENKNVVSTKEVLSAMTFYSSPASIGKDSTTDIIESRKLLRDELSIFDKLLDTASISLKKDKT